MSTAEATKAINSLLMLDPDDQEALHEVVQDYFTKPIEDNECYSDDEYFYDIRCAGRLLE